MTLYTGGSEKVRVDTSGNVGIGTSSPAVKLDVVGAISSTTDATLSGVRVGKGAGAISTNTALGSGALNSNTTGTSNTASGVNALQNNTTGSSNTASGTSALLNNTTGVKTQPAGRAHSTATPQVAETQPAGRAHSTATPRAAETRHLTRLIQQALTPQYLTQLPKTTVFAWVQLESLMPISKWHGQ